MTKINIKKKIWLACPSGLRGHVKAVMYSYAWVQTPQPTIKKYYSSDVAQRLACRAHNAKVGGSIPPVAIYGSSQQFLILHFKPVVAGSIPCSCENRVTQW